MVELGPFRLERWFAGTILGSAAFYLLLLPTFVTRLNPLTGDEPFYVMTAISLIRDRDLDESNNYADRDFEEFYPPDPLPAGWRGWPAFPRVLPPHPAMSRLPGLHTKHGLGLSLLIAVPYAVGGRIGADLVVILCGALLAGQMYLLGREAGADQRLAAGIALALAIAMPIAPYALLLFPEIPAALLLLYAVRRLAATSNTRPQMFVTGCAIGYLPWLHQRFGPTAAVLGIVLLARWGRRRPWSTVAVAAAPVAISGLLLVWYNEWLYSQPFQSTKDHAGFSHFDGAVNGFFGLFLDAQWGLLIAAPVLVLAIGALPWWYEAARRTVLISALAIVPYLGLVAAYRVWWGEWGPPARYLVPIVPFAAGPLAAWLARVARGWRLFALAIWACGMTLSVIGFRNPQRFYHQPDGVNHLVNRLGEIVHVDLAGRLVAFQPYAKAPRNEREAIVYLCLAAVVAVYLVVRVLPMLRSGGDRNPPTGR